MLLSRRNMAVFQSNEKFCNRYLEMPEIIVAMVGATGAVGLKILKCLEERNFPLSELKLFASTRSKGQKIIFGKKELVVEELTDQSFRGVNIAFFSAGSPVSKKFTPLAVKEGCVAGRFTIF